VSDVRHGSVHRGIKLRDAVPNTHVKTSKRSDRIVELYTLRPVHSPPSCMSVQEQIQEDAT